MGFHSESGPGDTHGIHYWRYANATDRDNHVPSEGPTDPITASDVAQKRICYVDSTGGYYHLTNHSPVTWVALGSAVLGDHSARHESGGADEISIAGLGGEAADPQPPKLHGSTHGNGNTDEISIAGLSGEAADPQPPKAHQLDPSGGEHTGTLPEGNVVFGGAGHSHGGGAGGAQVDYGDLLNVPSTFAPSTHAISHQDGQTDEINVGGLSGELADPQPVKAHALDPTGGDHTGTLGEGNVQFNDSTGHAHSGAGSDGTPVAHGDLSGVSADQHHARSHALDSASDHSGSLPEADVTFSGTGHAHGGGAGGQQVDYGDLLNVPSTFAPSSHALGGSAHSADSLANLNSKITGGKTLVAKEDANAWSRKQTMTAAAGEEAVEGTGGGNAAGNAYAGGKFQGGTSTGGGGNGGAGLEATGGAGNGAGVGGEGIVGTSGSTTDSFGVLGLASGFSVPAYARAVGAAFGNFGVGTLGLGGAAGVGGYGIFAVFPGGANGLVVVPESDLGGTDAGDTAIIATGGDNPSGAGGHAIDVNGGDSTGGGGAGGAGIKGNGGAGNGAGAGGTGVWGRSNENGGWGVQATGDSGGSPVRAALHLDPQDADPSDVTAGGIIVTSATHSTAGRVRVANGSAYTSLYTEGEEIALKLFSQAAEPTLAADGNAALWKDTDDSNRVYLIFRRGSGDHVKVELT